MTANMHDVALTFIARHQAEHLDSADLVRRTATYLQEQHDLSAACAFEVSAQAWAQLAARNSGDWVDMSRTTSHCVLLRLEHGRALAFTPQLLVQAAHMLDMAGVSLPES